ncbi:MAG TPA: sterol desaturase family protein [Gammaproteobacteria bacterium]|nr:sterol desaturase family protein [Gammaproteobacteria bacterium]
MLEFFLDQAYETVIDVGMGAAIWLVALLLPFRVLTAKKEYVWDVIGYVGSAFFGLVIVIYLEEPILDWSIAQLADWRMAFEALPWYLTLAIYMLVSDFGMYWSHRALHTDLLWDSHAWHHSPRYLYFLSGTRAGPIHIIVTIAPTTLAFVFFPDPASYWVATLHAAFQLANQHYLHCNLWVPFARTFEYAFITPRAHFVHHSRNRAYSDSNYGFIFSFWDRLFGTWTDPDAVPADEPLGLSYEISNWRAFWGLRPARSSTASEARSGAA